MRLKDLCVDAGQYGLNVSADEYAASGYRLIRITDINEAGLLRARDNAVFIDTHLDRRYRLEKGDLLLARSGATIGRSTLVGELEEPSTFAGYLVRFRPLPTTDARFLAYVATSHGFQDAIKSDAITSTIQNFNAERYANISIKVPPLDDQRRIADFLDAKTARIDNLRNAQLHALELLEERANSRILEVIGRSRLVKDDGEPITELRRVTTKLNRPVAPTEEVITAFRDGQVTARSVRRSEGYTVSANSDPQGQGVEIGDIVIHGLDGFAGAIGDSEASGNCSPVYHVCLPIDGGNSAFYGRLLKLLALDDYLALYGVSARERAVDFRNWKVFGRAPVPQLKPPIQHDIGNMITRVRPFREEVKRFNERLAERRQALITAAVTGEITV